MPFASAVRAAESPELCRRRGLFRVHDQSAMFATDRLMKPIGRNARTFLHPGHFDCTNWAMTPSPRFQVSLLSRSSAHTGNEDEKELGSSHLYTAI